MAQCQFSCALHTPSHSGNQPRPPASTATHRRKYQGTNTRPNSCNTAFSLQSKHSAVSTHPSSNMFAPTIANRTFLQYSITGCCDRRYMAQINSHTRLTANATLTRAHHAAKINDVDEPSRTPRHVPSPTHPMDWPTNPVDIPAKSSASARSCAVRRRHGTQCKVTDAQYGTTKVTTANQVTGPGERVCASMAMRAVKTPAVSAWNQPRMSGRAMVWSAYFWCSPIRFQSAASLIRCKLLVRRSMGFPIGASFLRLVVGTSPVVRPPWVGGFCSPPAPMTPRP
mmetsp:Transcript_14076/g.38623  ORF Transcript_14076/g.38623 Transcript_14076/m.38623 type:complete len:283 (-) Transcript_14076:76-924(-)